ncbi:MAG: cobalamin-dependent protein [Actinomycetota bacterium]|nr:cobalamin-dependent protein [Actinomycetota bacterium]
MGLKIRLVEPRPAGHNVYDLVLLPRLGLPLMGSMLVGLGHDVRVYCEVLSPVDLGECLSADLVGISSTTATSSAAYALADLLASAQVPVVLGGPHVTFRPDEALEHAPYVVRGEGERTMVELVASLERGLPLDQVLGLTYRDSAGAARHNPSRPRATQAEFELLPAPDLRLIEGHEQMSTKPVMTQWGCPFDCEFCSVTAMFSRSVRHRRNDQVLAELASLDARQVFFHDDNFVVNKARTRALLDSMAATGLTPTWFAQVRADSARVSPARPEIDHDFLERMHRAGCTMVMIGIEAITDEALAHVAKRQKVSTVEDSIHAFHDHRISVHGMFVAGLDTDAAGAAAATSAFARRLDIDTFQLMIETPLPGTRLWDRVVAEHRLLSDDWSLFDGHHVVMSPAQTTPLQLQLEVLDAMRRFYSWPRIVATGIASTLSHLPDLTACARPALLRRLPTAIRLASAQRWQDIAPLLGSALPERVRARARDALWLPAVRLYARRQISLWWSQDRSRAHVDLLAASS